MEEGLGEHGMAMQLVRTPSWVKKRKETAIMEGNKEIERLLPYFQTVREDKGKSHLIIQREVFNFAKEF